MENNLTSHRPPVAKLTGVGSTKRLLIRVPASLHAELTAKAQEEVTSLSLFCSRLLAQASGSDVTSLLELREVTSDCLSEFVEVASLPPGKAPSDVTSALVTPPSGVTLGKLPAEVTSHFPPKLVQVTPHPSATLASDVTSTPVTAPSDVTSTLPAGCVFHNACDVYEMEGVFFAPNDPADPKRLANLSPEVASRVEQAARQLKCWHE